MASIEPVLSLDRDRNRSLISRLVSSPSHGDPWQIMQNTLELHGVNGSELARSWFQHVTSNFRRICENYAASLDSPPPALAGLPRRRFEVLAPLLAIASLLPPGYPVSDPAASLGDLVVQRDAEGSEVGEAAELRDTLFHGPFPITKTFDREGRPIKHDVTLMKLVEENATRWADYSEAGIYIDPKSNGETYVLINWAGARKGPLSSNLTFARMSARRLVPLARELQEFVEPYRLRVGGGFVRVSVFRVHRLPTG